MWNYNIDVILLLVGVYWNKNDKNENHFTFYPK